MEEARQLQPKPRSSRLRRSRVGFQAVLRAFELTLHVVGAFVLALALFPYIFLLTKAQIKVSGIYIFKAAKSMGLKNSDAVIKVIIPSIKTSIIAGIILIVLETIADFGGVSTLRIDTFTVGIYDAWFGYQDYVTAAKLSIFLLIL